MSGKVMNFGIWGKAPLGARVIGLGGVKMMIGITIKTLMGKGMNKPEIAKAAGRDWKAVLRQEYFSAGTLSQGKPTSHLPVAVLLIGVSQS